MNIEQRIEQYQKDIERWNNIYAMMAYPTFNASRSTETVEYFESLSQHLKQEADALWHLGINVYK